MKSCDEMIRNVYERGEAEIKSRKKRRAMLMNIGAGTVAVCAAAGFVIMSNNTNRPEVSDSRMEGIVFSGESVTESVQTEAALQTAPEFTGTAVTTSTSSAITTTVVSSLDESIIESIQTGAALLTEPEFTETTITTYTSSVTTTFAISSLIAERCTVTTCTSSVTATTAVSSSDECFSTNGYCGDNVYYELDVAARTLYFKGNGSNVDVSAALPLVGEFDTVIIDKEITSFERLSENHLFGTGGPLTIYCSSDFKTDNLQICLGKILTFIICNE